jgi:hypothetical protein
LEIGFIDHCNTQLVITVNYSAIADLHTLQITSIRQVFPACSVFTRRFLETASNNGYSSASVLKSSLNGGSLPTAYCCPSFPPYNPSVRTTLENPFYNSSSIVARGLLPRVPFWLRSLLINGSIRCNILCSDAFKNTNQKLRKCVAEIGVRETDCRFLRFLHRQTNSGQCSVAGFRVIIL